MASHPSPERSQRVLREASVREREQLEVAWSFSGGGSSTASRSVGALAVLAAIGLHAALGLIRAEPHAPKAAFDPVLLETYTFVEREPDEEQPAPNLKPQASALRETAEHARALQAPVHPTSETSADAGDAPLAEDSAAELAASEFGDPSFELPSGSGLALGRGSTTNPGSGGMGFPGRIARSSTLAARDLSRPAIPPPLQPIVDANFPAAARLARVEGSVTISAVIQPDGNPTDVRVVDVDPRGRGFGETCTRTVHQGPDWQPKLNRDGRPVPSQVTYTCRFRLPDDLAVDIDAPTTGAGANRAWTKPAGG